MMGMMISPRNVWLRPERFGRLGRGVDQQLGFDGDADRGQRQDRVALPTPQTGPSSRVRLRRRRGGGGSSA